MQEEKKSHPVSVAGGNTISPATRSRQWCLTVNNWTADDMSQLSRMSQQSKNWIIGKEIGEEGTPHLQAFFQFKNQKRFSTIKAACPRAHIEKAKGNVQQNYKYCSKDGDFETNIKPKVTEDDLITEVLKSYEATVWKPWQQCILDLLADEPDSRTIVWVFEPTGNVGKSYIAKFLSCEPTTIISSGKATDIFNQVRSTIVAGHRPKTVICDIPRVAKDFVSYQALESLKNGLLYSGKYEGGKCVFPHPHVVCFANSMPDTSKMSADRWRIHEIKDDELFEKLARR